jgi:hypothetical protein
MPKAAMNENHLLQFLQDKIWPARESPRIRSETRAKPSDQSLNFQLYARARGAYCPHVLASALRGNRIHVQFFMTQKRNRVVRVERYPTE